MEEALQLGRLQRVQRVCAKRAFSHAASSVTAAAAALAAARPPAAPPSARASSAFRPAAALSLFY